MKPNRYRRLHELATRARPKNEHDWGSNRQIDAENEFFDEVERLCPKSVFDDLIDYCNKATTDERIAAGVEAAKGLNTFSRYRTTPQRESRKERRKAKKQKKPRTYQPWEAARPEP